MSDNLMMGYGVQNAFYSKDSLPKFQSVKENAAQSCVSIASGQSV
ncbi:hypothetical protein [Nostoc flagelliforme]